MLLMGSANMSSRSTSKGSCHTEGSLISEDIVQLCDVDYVDLDKETLIIPSSDMYGISNALFLTDRLAHCIHIYDMDRKRYHLFTGNCRNPGQSSGQPTRKDTLLQYPSSILYIKSSMTVSNTRYGNIRILSPMNDYSIYRVGCNLAYNEYCIHALASNLRYTGSSGIVRSAHSYELGPPQHIVTSNSGCRIRDGGLSSSNQANACVLYGTFLKDMFYFIDSSDQLLKASNMSMSLNEYKVLDLHYRGVYAYNDTQRMWPRYDVLSTNATDTMIAYSEEWGLIHLLKVLRSTRLPHTNFSVISNTDCGTEGIATYTAASMQSCGYMCTKHEVCIAFSYDYLTNSCTLHVAYKLHNSTHASNTDSVCYLLFETSTA